MFFSLVLRIQHYTLITMAATVLILITPL